MSALFVFIFIAAILFSIGLHEFGHFISAKRFGMKVHRFFIGFPPRIWSVQKGETEYGVGATLLGGYVKIAGMNPFEDVEPEDRDRVFSAKKPWQRAIVLVAGSFTHLLLGFVIIALILGVAGVADPNRPTTTVADVSSSVNGKSSPAAVAGIKRGDVLRSIDGVEIGSWDQAVEVIHARPGKRLRVVVERAGRPLALTATLAATTTGSPPNVQQVGFLGVGPKHQIRRFGPVASVTTAGSNVGEAIVASLSGLKSIFAPSTIRRLLSQAAGNEERKTTDPGTLVMVGAQAGGLGRTRDFGRLFYLIAVVNIFLGVANLMPLPPLDGGHLAFLVYEKVTRRSVDMRRVVPITAAVVSVLAGLFLLLLFLDITRPISAIPG